MSEYLERAIESDTNPHELSHPKRIKKSEKLCQTDVKFDIYIDLRVMN